MNNRQIVLLLSIASVVFYGYALGAAFNLLLAGEKNYFALFGGFAAGTACSFFAVKLWARDFR